MPSPRPLPFPSPRWCPAAGALALLLALAGCGRSDSAGPAPSAAPSATNPPGATLENDLEQLDATVWRDEVDARRHEAVFVQLADQLRTSADAAGVLGALAPEEIAFPRTGGPPEPMPPGLQRQRFRDDPPLALGPTAWQRAVGQFKAAGWTLAQSAWSHEAFTPARDPQPARSVFGFVLHGLAATNRFVARGDLEVIWAPALRTNTSPRPARLRVRNLELLEHAGTPGFTRHLLVAPEPARPGESVNVHPLIVTDLDADGDDDLALPGVNQWLRNDGRAGFTTERLFDQEPFPALREVGVLADFDGDGRPDYLGIPSLGPYADMLTFFPGSGAPPFRLEPRPAWPEQRDTWPARRLAAPSVITAGDIDGDGDLDVWIGQYRPPYVGGQLPTPYYDANDGRPSFLLRNDGRGRFTEVREAFALLAKNHRRVLAGSLADVDGDGDVDLVTLNDFAGVDLFLNDSRGGFSDATARLGERRLFGMGHVLADLDGDGRLDLFALGMSIPTVRRLDRLGARRADFPERTAARSAMAYGNRTWLGAPDGTWVPAPFADALSRSGWAWGVAAPDLDNNGRPELYVANGHVSGASVADYDSLYWTRDIYLGNSREDPALQRYHDGVLRDLNAGRTSWNGHQFNALFLDPGDRHPVDVAWLLDLAHATDCRAVASADLDRDGRMDLVVTEALWDGGPNRMRHRVLVHLNRLPVTNHWIGVRFTGGTRPGNAIGATVRARLGGSQRIAQVLTGDSFQAQQPATLHFGLGNVTEVDELTVTWPDGRRQQLPRPAVDRWHALPANR